MSERRIREEREDADRMEAERDAATERAEKAERERDELRRELHRIACGIEIESDALCEYGIEAANLRARVAELEAVAKATEAARVEIEAGTCPECCLLGEDDTHTQDCLLGAIMVLAGMELEADR